jgi:hypothetical protein
MRDAGHEAVRVYATQTLDLLLVPVTVLPEADYLMTTRLGTRVAVAMLRSVVRGELKLEELTIADLARSIELIEQYAHSNIGFVDASIVAIAERLRITRVLTLDHRHFAMVRPRHCPALELLP